MQPLRTKLLELLEQINASQFSVDRLESLLTSIRLLNKVAYDQVRGAIDSDLRHFTVYETGYQTQLLVTVVPLQVHVAAVNAEQVYAAAMARPFQGMLLKDILTDLEQGRAKKIKQTIAQGFVENRDHRPDRAVGDGHEGSEL
jgi:hypothetical protein